MARSRSSVPARLRANVLAVQGAITVAFLLFILVTSNPFARVDPAPLEGQDLNPVLQDLGLAIHPPLLYIGYVGFSITFAFAIAALIDGRIDAVWARAVRPWTLGAWVFLTLGIAMGSYWAYYELGWGGWWFWDPVENASLMPWLAGTALLHSAVVMEKRDALKVWTILLADPDLLAVAARHLPGALGRADLGARLRHRPDARHLHPGDPGAVHRRRRWPCSPGARRCCGRAGCSRRSRREGALVLNNLFLATACATVFVGTLYPLALEALTGDKISVGAPFFNLTFVPLVVPLLCWCRSARCWPGSAAISSARPSASALAFGVGLVGHARRARR